MSLKILHYIISQMPDRFRSGNFTDQTIEQDLMRLVKSSSGMTRSQGITDSTLTKWTQSFPKCISICEGLEKLANIHTTSSEQHNMNWLHNHPPYFKMTSRCHYEKISHSYMYVSYVQRHFGLNTVVVFDGYESSNSTKVVKQQRQASKGVSRDLLFDERIKAVSTHSSFLANATNKSQIIAMILSKFQHHGMSLRCLKIMEAPQRTLLMRERNSSSTFISIRVSATNKSSSKIAHLINVSYCAAKESE